MALADTYMNVLAEEYAEMDTDGLTPRVSRRSVDKAAG